MLPWVGESGERNPGIASLISSAREAGDRILRSFRARKILSDVIQGWRDLRSLTLGYYLELLRGWLS